MIYRKLTDLPDWQAIKAVRAKVVEILPGAQCLPPLRFNPREFYIWDWRVPFDPENPTAARVSDICDSMLGAWQSAARRLGIDP